MVCKQYDLIFQYATPVHEIGHVIGLYHEQSRTDRDEFVTIFEQNIDPDNLFNYDKAKQDMVTTHGVPYDYSSVMHYGLKVNMLFLGILNNFAWH